MAWRVLGMRSKIARTRSRPDWVRLAAKRKMATMAQATVMTKATQPMMMDASAMLDEAAVSEPDVDA